MLPESAPLTAFIEQRNLTPRDSPVSLVAGAALWVNSRQTGPEPREGGAQSPVLRTDLGVCSSSQTQIGALRFHSASHRRRSSLSSGPHTPWAASHSPGATAPPPPPADAAVQSSTARSPLLPSPARLACCLKQEEGPALALNSGSSGKLFFFAENGREWTELVAARGLAEISRQSTRRRGHRGASALCATDLL